VFDVLAHFLKRSEIVLERVGLVCFAVAVLAEILAYPYSRRNDGLSAAAAITAEREIGQLRKDAESAKAAAKGFESQIADAAARVKSAEAQIASANAAAREAVAKVAQADARIAEANRGAAEANRVAEGERLARERLESRLAGRSITDEQISLAAEQLKQFSEQPSRMDVGISDLEGLRFASRLSLLLTSAGWNVNLAEAVGSVRRSGISISRTEDKQSCEAAEKLARVLSNLGFESFIDPTPETETSRIVLIHVGPKPENEERLEDRIFTPEQRSKLTAELAKLPKFGIAFASPDGEPLRYARQIMKAFDGWDIVATDVGTTAVIFTPPQAASIRQGGLQQAPRILYGAASGDHARILAQAFSNAGMKVVMAPLRSAGERTVVFIPAKAP
jgi:hypothetical protein